MVPGGGRHSRGSVGFLYKQKKINPKPYIENELRIYAALPGRVRFERSRQCIFCKDSSLMAFTIARAASERRGRVAVCRTITKARGLGQCSGEGTKVCTSL